jgi:TrmH family RNA methyltransferase
MTRGRVTLTSRQHALVKRFRAAAHGDDSCALIDGWHLLHEAVAAGLAIDVVALTTDAAATDAAGITAAIAAPSIVIVSSAVMSAISPVRTPSGVVALVHRLDHTLHAVLRPPPAFAVVAIDLQDPGNAGAIVRAAEAGGATGVLLAGASADPWGWKALRASMGSTFRLPVVASRDVAVLIDALVDAGIGLVAAVPRGGVSMDAVDLTAPAALLVGGEGPGLPPSVLTRAATHISIPMVPRVESLNAAIAAAVLVYEARRQRILRAPKES